MPTDRANASSVPPETLGDLLTAAELARKLKVKVSYLRRLRHRHGLPWARVGNEIRYSREAVIVWLEKRSKPKKSVGGRP